MPVTIAFDVYGTLIDTAGIVATLRELLGEKATAFSDLWRSKQLEYSFRRGLMQNYRDFSICTSNALDFCCAALEVQLKPEQRAGLLDAYRFLPTYPDVGPALVKFRQSGLRLYAFSNGKPADVQNLLKNAGIDLLLDGLVSTDEIKSFKPNPGVYAHFLRQSGACGADAWLISGNPFDVIGAISAGMHGAWVKRSSQAVFDPWEIQPSLTVADLDDLFEAIGC